MLPFGAGAAGGEISCWATLWELALSMSDHVHSRYLYELDASPPWHDLLLLGLQHAVLALVFLVYPLAAAQQIGLSSGETAQFLTACVLAIAVSTALHYFRPMVGSGALAVEIPTPIFLPAAVLVGGVGGLATLSGMSLVSGLIECLFARLLKRLRSLFPAEVCGVAVMMLGISMVKPGVLNALGVTAANTTVDGGSLLVAALTVTTITGVSIFGAGRVKLLALGAGLCVGIVLAMIFGVVSWSHWAALSEASWVGVPSVHLGVPRIEPTLIPLCIVMALVLSVDNIGMLVGIQRQINPSWSKIDLRQASGGIQVSGIGDLVAAVFGGMPTGISSANVSLAYATGAIARRISLATGALLLVAACTPKVIVALSLIPKPVVGAVMVYAAAYMLVSGMSLILGRLLNERRIFVIGFAVVMGLMPALVPGIYAHAPELARPILESPLAVGTFTAILLTQFFRVGAARRATFSVELVMTDNESLREYHINKSIRDTLSSLGVDAGAARTLVDRAIDVTSELVAVMKSLNCFEQSVLMMAAFEDSRLKIVLQYAGSMVPEKPVMPPDHQSANDPLSRAWQLLSGPIDKSSGTKADGQQRLTILFEA